MHATGGPGSGARHPVHEPSGRACEHYQRYPEDVALLAELGLNTYRYSIEWARIEPEEGVIDQEAVDHYLAMTDRVREAGLTPFVTLNHFTLPAWLGRRGGWLDAAAPRSFARYCTRVVEALGDRVDWYATINEPGVVAFGGYLGALGFPPGGRTVGEWERANQALIAAHLAARDAVRTARPEARVGQTLSLTEWEADAGATPLLEYLRRMTEDVFIEASADDDWVGIQTYTRQRIALPDALAPVLRRIIAVSALRRVIVPVAVRRGMRHFGHAPSRDGVRRTLMGYEFRPEAVAATLRRTAALLPGKPLVVTEHGVATRNDRDRVEFVRRGLTAVHDCLTDGLPILGYLHWSALDNYEWAHGYAPTFGLIEVDRKTQQRTVRPSARVLGEIARTGALTVE